jgi:hypothetical protein
MAISEKLKACPACGKREGELIENKRARFPFRVQCSACGWMTDQVKLAAVAVKLWNEAKTKGKEKRARYMMTEATARERFGEDVAKVEGSLEVRLPIGSTSSFMGRRTGRGP